MACRGLVQNASSFTSSLPSKALRKTIVSRRTPKHFTVASLANPPQARSFQVLARESRQHLPSSTSLLPSQRARAPPCHAPCRALHGSPRAWAPETQEPDEHHRPQALKAVTNETGKKKGTDRSNPTARLNAKLVKPTLPELVRKKMRRVPQPVTIVTSSNTQTHPDGNPQGWHGATISSFNTVTLTPVPIISFNIRNNSSTFAAIKASGRLWVHFLTVAPSATNLAKHFARQRHGYPGFLTHGRTEKGHENEAAQQQPDMVPLIPTHMGADGRIAFILECIYMKDKTVSIGDHVVLFASVVDVINTASNYVFEGTGFQPRRPCLVYADGEYQGVTPLENPGVEQKPLNMSQREESIHA